MREFFTDEYGEPEAPPQPKPVFDPTRLYLGLLALLVLALLVRSVPLRRALDRNIANVPALNAALAAAGDMPAAAGDSPETSTAAALDGPPNGLQARALARIALAQGRADEAERRLVAGLSDTATADLTLFELCRLYQSYDRLEDAKRACAGSIVSAPYWLSQGLRADEAGQTELAVEYFDLARTIDPNKLTAWTQLGHALFVLKRYEEAIPVHEYVIRNQVTPRAGIFYELGQALIHTGRPEQARAILEQGVGRHPEDRAMYLALADALRAQANLDAADQWYVNLLKRWPQDGYTWAKRAELAMLRGRPADAVTYLQEATRLEKSDAGHWLGLAGAAEAAGNRVVARQAFEQALRLRPNDVDLLLQIGRFLSNGNETAAAKTIFEHVLTLQPDNPEARQWLERVPAQTASP